MKWRIVAVALLAFGVHASATFEPPPSASRLCAGHVTGAPHSDGTPGLHISWTAYWTAESPRTVAKRYLESLDPKLHEREDNCDIWRDPPDDPEHVLEVCPVSARGPWSDCKGLPPRARTIIMISSMAGK